MEIQIIQSTKTHYANIGATYHSTEMRLGNHGIIFIVAVPDAGQKNQKRTYHIHNTSSAMARAWGSLGRTFFSVADAVAHYKTPAIRAMIEHAAAMV